MQSMHKRRRRTTKRQIEKLMVHAKPELPAPEEIQRLLMLARALGMRVVRSQVRDWVYRRRAWGRARARQGG